jgi:pimeloyl-ACP methyl ester carboxylesterase
MAICDRDPVPSGMPFAQNGSYEIFYETFGRTQEPTLVLVNGLGSQCTAYHDDWCAMFAARGLQVVRLDNRDAGLSSGFKNSPYRLSDMAADVIAVLDVLGVAQAHVMGLSMGGMIVQTLAIEHAERLLSVTSVMSHTGESEFAKSSPAAYAALTAAPASDRESYVQQWIAGMHVWGTPEFADEQRWTADAMRAYDRAFRPDGTARQFNAIKASGSRAEGLRKVALPMLVLHGDRDTLIDQIGGRRTAELVPNASFVLIEGLGHDYPPQLWERWTNEVVNFIGMHMN